MSAPTREPSTVIFVGNIAFESQEKDLRNLLEEVGPVIKLRLVRDDNTGKLKGYAFCEYQDQALARKAVSYLNDREFNGRHLRVDYADQKSTDPGHESSNNSNLPPPVIQGTNYYPDKQVIDPMMNALTRIPPKDLIDALGELKEIARSNPDNMRNLLKQEPRLALLTLHGQYLLGIINEPFLTHPMGGMPPIGPMGGMPPMGGPMMGGPMGPPPMMGGPMGPPGMGMGGPIDPNAWRNDPKFKDFRHVSNDQLRKLLRITPQQLQQLGEAQRKLVLHIQHYARELNHILG